LRFQAPATVDLVLLDALVPLTTVATGPKDKQLKLKDYFIKQIRSYMNGDIPVATVVKGTSASSNTKSTVAGAWKRNSYGSWIL
jgi:hypothetical protein